MKYLCLDKKNIIVLVFCFSLFFVAHLICSLMLSHFELRLLVLLSLFIALVFFIIFRFFNKAVFVDVDEYKILQRTVSSTVGLLHMMGGIDSLLVYNDLIRNNIDSPDEALNLIQSERGHILSYYNRVRLALDDISSSFSSQVVAIDLRKSIEESLSFLKAKWINENHIGVEVNMPDSPVTYQVVPSHFKLIIENILNNSYEVLTDNPSGDCKISIVMKDLRDSLTISIINTGPNIGDFKSSVPLDFFKPGKSTKKNGTGLGMYVSKNLVKSCQANLGVRNLEDGVEFVITFKKNV
jgi:signal transduction histidine kinase